MKAIDLNPDLVILDYSMPGMDGLHVAEEIYKALPATVILICTLFLSRELEREATKYGVTQVISKTEMSRDLVAFIEDFHHSPKLVS